MSIVYADASVSILKSIALPDVDADVGREALDGLVAGAVDVPHSRVGAGLGVLARDLVARRTAGVRGVGREPDRPGARDPPAR